MRKFIEYIQSSIAELRKVTWPNRKDIVSHTGMIIFSVAVATLLIAALDYGLGFLVNRFLIQ